MPILSATMMWALLSNLVLNAHCDIKRGTFILYSKMNPSSVMTVLVVCILDEDIMS
jgi:hypothetical protein